MRILYRTLAVFVAVCVAAVTILGACNIVFRMPDIYIYEFNSQEISSQIDLGMGDDELGTFFSDFMKGSVEEFDLFIEYRDRDQNVFGTVEQINMEHARKLLNDSLYALVGGAFILIALYCIFLHKKWKYELRGAFKLGIAFFVAAQAALHITFNIASIRLFYYQLIFPIAYGADDVLPLMFTERFARLSVFANSAVAFVLLLILASATWKLTKPRRMFYS
ncbi:MAG: hypothetical protein K0Q48_703 [Bacillota bacterium]|nr:hypothetical protein [Bacillota bacterium]